MNNENMPQQQEQKPTVAEVVALLPPNTTRNPERDIEAFMRNPKNIEGKTAQQIAQFYLDTVVNVSF